MVVRLAPSTLHDVNGRKRRRTCLSSIQRLPSAVVFVVVAAVVAAAVAAVLKNLFFNSCQL